MKYYKRLKIYKSNNVTFDPETMIADSYDWWHFVEKINGKIVFNDHSYSQAISNHQQKVWSLLKSLNIKLDLVIHTQRGLQACYGVDSHEALAYEAITYAIRNETLSVAEQIADVFKVPLTNDFIQRVYDQQELDMCDEYLERAYQYSEKKLKEKSNLVPF